MSTAPRNDARPGQPQLRRALGPWLLFVLAVGDILGAGIYALVGVVAAAAGNWSWLSFLAAGAVALLTGLTYAELSSRAPVAASAAGYCRRAFDSPLIAFVVGILVLASAVTSSATIARACVGYLEPFFTWMPGPVSVLFLAGLGAINFLGIEQSARANLLMTVVEVFGLLLVLAVGTFVVWNLPAGGLYERWADPVDWNGVALGAGVAVFAFIGFEDIVTVAEEAIDPRRDLPRAILFAVGACCLLYVGVTVVLVLAVPLARIETSQAPLLEVLEASPLPFPPALFSVIALVAIGNTGLLNLISASRIAYGMAAEGLLPAALARVHPSRQTPSVAIIVTVGLACLLAVTGDISELAQTTSLLLLCVFAVLHVALLQLKRGSPDAGPGVFRTPRMTPWLGLLVCTGLIPQFPPAAYLRAATGLVAALLLYGLAVRRRKHV